MISYILEKPLALSLYRHIRHDIESGLFVAHDKLPSKRQYALDLHLSLSTVEQALSLLEQEGYIVAKERKGFFVLDGNIRPQKQNPFQLHPLEPDLATPDHDFPASLWFKTMRMVMSRDQEYLLQTSHGAGSHRLRNVIANYLVHHRSMNVQPEQIVIASGSQELYFLLCRMFKEDFHVALESPCYPIIEQVYQASNATIEKLELDQDGIQLEQLANSQSQFLHVSPFSSFPGLIKASPTRRKAYLSWIKNKAGYLIEDDFNSEFFQSGPMLQTLYALDHHQKVIYLNTFSKSLSSSLRLSYMVLPPSLIALYQKTAGHLACTVTMLEQYTLAEFIENGSFERLIVRRRRHQVQLHKSNQNNKSYPEQKSK